LKSSTCRTAKCSGLTLPELLVTIAIAAIVMAIAVPSFRESFLQNLLSTQINQLVFDLNFARSEAVKRGGPPVALCKSTDGATCDATAANWNRWLVFVDTNGNNLVDGGEMPLRSRPVLPTGFTLSASSSFANAISYRPTGVTVSMGQFTLCQGNTFTHARAVFVNVAGRIYLGQDGNNNHKPEDENGADITTCTPP
jgi:type IV fimbrial biogenesis protein FimT